MGIGNLMRGILVQTLVRCGCKGCVCEIGEKRVKVYFSLNLHGRTRGCYVGGREETVAPPISEYQRAWHLIEQLTEVNLELIRSDHPDGRRRKKWR